MLSNGSVYVNRKKIILTGGGTMGSVTPLLNLKKIINNSPLTQRKLKESKDNPPFVKGGGGDFIWIGTKNGIEREAVEKEGIAYYGISAGKLRRYWDKKNISDVVQITKGFLEAKKILKKEKPDLVITAGSFVSVPIVWAAKFLKIPVIIIQLDYKAGLANKLMAPVADKVLVTFQKSLKDYPRKGIYLGAIINNEELRIKNYELRDFVNDNNTNNYFPTILVLGGGTGSQKINELIMKTAPKLNNKCTFIIITGKNKNLAGEVPSHPGGGSLPAGEAGGRVKNIQTIDFLPHNEIIKFMLQSDIIISRCGMGTLIELSYLGKPSILIPMPDSHQEDNARIFADQNAAIVLNQKGLTAEKLEKGIIDLLSNKEKQKKLSKSIRKTIKIADEKELINIINQY